MHDNDDIDETGDMLYATYIITCKLSVTYDNSCKKRRKEKKGECVECSVNISIVIRVSSD